MKKRTKGLLIIILVSILAVCAAVLSIANGTFDFSRFGIHTNSFDDKAEREFELPEEKSESEQPLKDDEKIENLKKRNFNTNGLNLAMIFIEGQIGGASRTYDQDFILSAISRSESDRKNAGILLVLNTPGGALYDCDEVYLRLMDYKKKTGRPVYAYMEDMACSAGYYISCASDKIIANRNTITGSIGVIFGQNIDATELMEKVGIKSRTIHAGRNKNMMNFNEPFTQEQQSIMQSLADEAYEQFVSIVCSGRNLKTEKVHSLADGRVYSANQALKNGLIDEILGFDEAKKEFQTKIAHDLAVDTGRPVEHPEYKVYRFEEKFNLSSLINEKTGVLEKIGMIFGKSKFENPLMIKSQVGM